MKRLRAHRADTLAAGDLGCLIGRSGSATSQRLKVLRAVGAVTGRPEGEVVHYWLSANINGQVIGGRARGVRSARRLPA